MDHPHAQSLADALSDVVYAIGGPKAVAAELWPSKFRAHPESAARYVSQCLDPARREKLSLDELEWLLAAGREAEEHGAMYYLARRCHYAQPEPITPDDERAQLQREFIAAVESQQQIADRLAALVDNVAQMRSPLRRVG